MVGIPDYSRLIKEVFDTSLRVKPRDRVWIQSWDHTLDLAYAFASECASRDCPWMISVRQEGVWLRSIIRGSRTQLMTLPPQEKALLEETDFFIFTRGPRKPIPWSSIAEEKRGEVPVWLDTRYDKSTYARRWERVAKACRVKMLAMEATLATPERARALGLNYEEWKDVMFRGCMTDHTAIARRANRLTELLSGKARVSLTSPAGTRLEFDLDSRPIGVSDGMSTEEMAKKGRIVFLPAGAIEVSVDEGSAQGRIVYDSPVRLGSEMIENLVINLKDGRIAHYTATQGSKALGEYLKRGVEDAGRFSYFGFGLNPNLKHGFTQDDKVLGDVTLGFGDNRSIEGKNHASDHWWASVSKTTAKVDGVALSVEMNGQGAPLRFLG